MNTPFFYGQEPGDTVAYHNSASALDGLKKIEDIAPSVEFLVQMVSGLQVRPFLQMPLILPDNSFNLLKVCNECTGGY